MKKAEITVLWIGENKPDTFSWLIQFVLTLEGHSFFKMLGIIWELIVGKRKLVNFSHNAFLFKGQLYHSTTPGGNRMDRPEDELKDSKIRAFKKVTLNIAENELEYWLRGELGKGYAHWQNYGLIISFFLPFTMSWFKNGNKERNCSELVAEVCRWSEFQIPECIDYVLPSQTARILGAQFEELTWEEYKARYL